MTLRIPSTGLIIILLSSFDICCCNNSDRNETAILNSARNGPAASHSTSGTLNTTDNMQVLISSHQGHNESISDSASSVTKYMTTASQSSPVSITLDPPIDIHWDVLEEEPIPHPILTPGSIESEYCPQCLPEFLGGSSLYQSMTRWNNLVCGKHVCNVSLQEAECGTARCAECQCDEDCMRYGDCCPDIFLNHPPKDPVTEFTCVSEAFIQANDSTPKRYLMVASCPEKSPIDDASTTEKCLRKNALDIVENTPVYSKATDRHYKNVYCAKCHGISDYTTWLMESSCQSYVDYSKVTSLEQLLDLLRREERCHVHFTHPKFTTARQCYHDSNFIPACNVSGQWKMENYNPEIELACGLFTESMQNGYGLESDITYKNPFCAYCNGETLYKTGTCSYPIIEPGTVPFSVMFNFRNDQLYGHDNQVGDSVKCDGDQVYDPFKKRCRPLFCPYGKYPVENSCENFVDSAKGLGYIMHYVLKPRNSSFITITDDLSYFAYRIRSHASTILSWVALDFHVIDTKIRYSVVNVSADETVNQVSSMDIQFAMLVGEMFPKDELEVALVNYVKRGWWYYDTDAGNPTYFDSEWVTSVSDDRIDRIGSPKIIVFSSGKYGNETLFEINSVDNHYREGRTIPEIYKSNATAYILVTELMQCNLIKLGETEYNQSLSGDVVVHFNGDILSPGQYTTNGERIRICTNFSGQPDTSPTLFDDAEVIITIVCTSLSLAGLAITFTVYLFNPSLRTLPGKNNMALFLNLFIAQLMFQSAAAADVSIPVCQTFGVIIHYFWLSSFCWKFVCAFHMFRIFTNPLKMLREFRSFLQYVVFAQAFPLIFIFVYIMIHYFLSGKVSIGYADRDIGQGTKLCFLSSTLDVALGFVFPVGVTILLNALLFSRVVYELRTRPDVPRKSARSDVNETVIYLKMSVLLGFTWGLGFIALVWNVQPLWTVFTVVNASIGLFIFFSFGLKKVSFRKWVGQKSTSSENVNATCETKLGKLTLSKGIKELTDVSCVSTPDGSPVLCHKAAERKELVTKI